MKLTISATNKDWKPEYGTEIEFDKGYLTVNGYDGVTLLDKIEARELAYCLLDWCEELVMQHNNHAGITVYPVTVSTCVT